jgi:membrane protein DedA with SNARE-associated domain
MKNTAEPFFKRVTIPERNGLEVTCQCGYSWIYCGMSDRYASCPKAFLAALLETIFPPIPSELIFPLIGFTAQTKGLGLENAIGMATIGALGSTIGSIAIYFVALKLEKRVFLRLGKYMKIGES